MKVKTGLKAGNWTAVVDKTAEVAKNVGRGVGKGLVSLGTALS